MTRLIMCNLVQFTKIHWRRSQSRARSLLLEIANALEASNHTVQASVVEGWWTEATL